MKKERDVLVGLGVRVAPDERERVDAWRQKYAALPRGMTPRVLLLMGLAGADDIGGLDLSVLGPTKNATQRRVIRKKG